ncbi:clustering-based subsystem [Methylobacterium phyllosphaerae]|uniref:Clustering-based subsystem n=1 Tax=Methylobacterium phyllosphaerae TaxID=418223 RepID=A0AAE8HTW1_9HYPH|nr:3'-5' exonuclease [Methylobacterium phyllosphaerae]APT34566.1 clustering-based subsystem [Methylobacterium phyllosphaerae]SFH19108.1 DNA polymerase-3 subunit epsilon [Methylobacterium phyllosphaerae]
MDYFLGEFHAHALKGHPDYRVLRRVEGRSPYPRDVPSNAQTGILIHVDTTGPNPDGDEIIVLAMIRFAFTEKGTIFGPLESYLGLNQPKKPIPPYVTRATGITDEAVKGKRINARFVGDFIKTAELIVCHDAARARRFCERLQSDFQHRAWACSRVQIRWSHEGVGCTELPFIAYRQGYFFEGDASRRLEALLEILEMPLPQSGQVAIVALAAAAQRETSQVWALGASYEVREDLRKRGYRWHGGHDGRYRAWVREVDPTQVEAERRFLDSLDVPDLCPIVTTIDATLRFSDRIF